MLAKCRPIMKQTNKQKQTSKCEITQRPRRLPSVISKAQLPAQLLDHSHMQAPNAHLQQHPFTQVQLSIPLTTLSCSNAFNTANGTFPMTGSSFPKAVTKTRQSQIKSRKCSLKYNTEMSLYKKRSRLIKVMSKLWQGLIQETTLEWAGWAGKPQCS